MRSLLLFRERPATADDYEDFARLFLELGVDDPTPSREAWAGEMAPSALVLEQGGAVIGYVYAVVLGDMGYVRHVAVAPSARGKGAGRALMRAIGRRLRAASCARWCLNVKLDNAPAIGLYASLGMTKAYESTAMRLGWDVVACLPSEPDGARFAGRIIEPREDAALEKAFGLPSGRIDEARTRAGWVVMRLVDAVCPDDPRVGLACFNPAFPGSFPFRVARPTLARPLLSALRPRARPEDSYTQVVIEGDPETKRALVAAGAVIRLELMNMEGAIPGDV